MNILFRKFHYKLKKKDIISMQLINTIVKDFNETVLKDFLINIERNVLIIVKIEYRNNDKYKTIAPIQIINMLNINILNQLLYKILVNIDIVNVKNIQLLYLPIPLSRGIITETLIEFIEGVKLPNSMDFTLWGSLFKKSSFVGHEDIFILNSNLDTAYYIKNLSKDLKHWLINEVYVLVKNTNQIIEFKDYRENKDNINTFLRKIDNHILHYIDGELVSKINIKPYSV
jgi:hypothetical protein